MTPGVGQPFWAPPPRASRMRGSCASRSPSGSSSGAGAPHPTWCWAGGWSPLRTAARPGTCRQEGAGSRGRRGRAPRRRPRSRPRRCRGPCTRGPRARPRAPGARRSARGAWPLHRGRSRSSRAEPSQSPRRGPRGRAAPMRLQAPSRRLSRRRSRRSPPGTEGPLDPPTTRVGPSHRASTPLGLFVRSLQRRASPGAGH
mmetsp:Transcript_141612/g.440255  ORF Transcript_141612/g.440255 Transcript_141612/m.440255 type:complete len:200 (+) Transcript_141612:1736-2335(+)